MGLSPGTKLGTNARLLATLLFLGAALPALAALDGSISGVVRDSSGQPIPAVTVEIRGPVLLGARSTLTRADGTYRLPSLPPGTGYELAFRLTGFRTVTASAIPVNLSQDTQVNATLPLADVRADVVVTDAAPLVDVTQTNTSTAFTAEHLRTLSLGSRARSYQQVLSQAAGVTDIPGSEGIPFQQIFGGTAVENAYLVDGVNSTDPVDHMWSINLSFDSIQEVSLQTSSFLPEYGRATGGVVSVVTKSGGNEFHGSGDLRFASSSLAQTGEHFDPETTPYRSSPWSLTLGGPLLKDELWFFGNAQRIDDVRTPYTDDPIILAQITNPADRRSDGWYGGGKLSFRLGEHWNGFGSYSSYKNTVQNTWGMIYIWQPEAAILAVNQASQASLKMDGVLSDRWLVEAQGGVATALYDYGPSGGSDDVSSWLNIGGQNVRYDSHLFHWRSDRERRFGALSSTYFLTGRTGNHELKTGLYADTTRLEDLFIRTGSPSDPSLCTPEPGVRGAPVGSVCGAQFLFDGFDASGQRIPYQQQIAERRPSLTYRGRAFSAYVQDQWRPTSRLTVNLGLRWDRNEYFNNEDLSVATLSKLQPRLSAAFDLTGDGRTVARASWGLFYLDAPLSLMSNAATGLTAPYYATYDWSPSTHGWTLVPGSESGGMAFGILNTPPIEDPLESIYEEQINVALEREVLRGLAVSLTYVYKKTHNLFDNTCSDYTACPFLWISNWPGRSLGLDNPLARTFYGWILSAAWKDPKGRALAAASYMYGKSRGSLEYTDFFGSSPDFDFYPYEFVNRYGYLSGDVRHQIKVSASYRIPRIETTIAATYVYRSGLPWTPWDYDSIGWSTVFLEPRGSERTPVLNNLDLQLEKRFALDGLAKGLSASVFATVYNVFGTETPTTIESYAQSPLFGQPTVWTLPRSLELGVRLEF
ncbi:MAG: TonB-dependent receptor [Acidobacteriota bacterium]